jgi:hypothetical protein
MPDCPRKVVAIYEAFGVRRFLRIVTMAIGIFCWASAAHVFAQIGPGVLDHSDKIRGTVLNSVTHEPIGRALVLSPDDTFATLTDDRGRFEFTFPSAAASQADGSVQANPAQLTRFGASNANRPNSLMARKVGFLPTAPFPMISQMSDLQDLTISLVPEARIVGHVILSGSNDLDRMQLDLYRRAMREGREYWERAGSARTRSDGEFRFAELPAGDYKLLTSELLDRDPLTFDPRGQLFGYPPVYYPSASDFATAAVIRLSAGETFQATMSPSKRAYYQVKIGLTNPLSNGPVITVWPQANRGPGYSLGYNDRDQKIEASLPDGTYTVQAITNDQQRMSGLLNITIGGAALDGPTITLLPAASMTVNVREEFQHTDTSAAQEPIVQSDARFPNGFSVSPRRPPYLQVGLIPEDPFGFTADAALRPPAGPEDDSLVIEKIQPGTYRVSVTTSVGYPASVAAGGVDLLRKPLVVGPGASLPAMEIEMRDDGAEVGGTVDFPANLKDAKARPTFGSSSGIVYFVPTETDGARSSIAWINSDGAFTMQQLRPGTYRVLAVDRQRSDLAYASGESATQNDAKVRVIDVQANQKEHLRLPLIVTPE